jgi:hypothetical protein
MQELILQAKNDNEQVHNHNIKADTNEKRDSDQDSINGDSTSDTE